MCEDSDSDQIFRFPHQAILQQQLNVLRLSSVLTLRRAPEHHSFRSYRLRARSCEPCLLPHQLQSQVLRVSHLCSWPTGGRLAVPATSFLSLVTLLEWHTELRDSCYLLGYWFIIQGYNSGTGRCIKQNAGKRCGASCPLQAFASWLMHIHQPHSLVWSTSHLINITRHLSCSCYLGNSKDFRSSVLEMGTKTKRVCIINHNITSREIRMTKTAARRN